MDPRYHASAARIRSLLAESRLAPTAFRAALVEVPSLHRDAWLDQVLELGEVPDDGPSLPRECVPYLPCSVNTVLQLVDDAGVNDTDVFIDIGSGLGRAAMAVRLLTGAAVIGLEIQPELAQASRALAARLKLTRVALVEGDAAELAGCIALGTVFFLYCPFGGERLEQVLGQLEAVARVRPIRVCCVDLPLPGRPWLAPAAAPQGPLAVYRSAAREHGLPANQEMASSGAEKRHR